MIKHQTSLLVVGMISLAPAVMAGSMDELGELGQSSSRSLFALFSLPEIPPLIPAHEIVVSADSPFVANCLVVESRALAALHDHVVRSVATLSFRWGPIWRADYEDASAIVPARQWGISRIVCWQGQNMKGITDEFAMFQRIPPLDPSTITP